LVGIGFFFSFYTTTIQRAFNLGAGFITFSTIFPVNFAQFSIFSLQFYGGVDWQLNQVAHDFKWW